MAVRTRFAPSPTGVLHLGSIRTALFCWLYARHTEGQFVLRIEDTDRERSTQENVDAILDGMEWLGLDADEGPIFQSDRYERYAEIVDKWLVEGHAYKCFCTREELEEVRSAQMAAGETIRYNGKCRDNPTVRDGASPVVRFRNPQDGSVTVNDHVRGNVVFNNEELGDIIIARSDGSPTYNFAVVVDDADMQITHVIRGDDHLPNTPKQINMFQALGAEVPEFVHLPMILGPDGAKLSKRHGAVDIRDYRDKGYLPEAMLNYLVRLGWSHGDKEIFSRQEMVQLFDTKDINQSASAFNPEKLLWLNQQHIMSSPQDVIGDALVPFLVAAGLELTNGPSPRDVAEAYRERAETLVQMAESSSYCYQDFDEIDPAAAKKHLRPVVLPAIKEVREKLGNISNWQKHDIANAIEQTAEQFELKLGKLGQPIRVAVTGGSISPPIDVTVWLVGQERTLARLDHAIEITQLRADTANQ